MRALKSLVIGLGILIVIAMGLLVWGLFHKAGDPDFRLFAESPAVDAAPATPPAAFGDLVVPLPAGCSIVEMRPQGRRLFLRFGPPGPCERVVVVDTGTGVVLGTIRGNP